ncbi:hypothetical protein [Stenotrophomonas sp. MMGLT7]|uniref:hypothetical protein n=1 Tax=Stenotrophomonas sp. MMGLT7 TaxID=2901227 RepID=UPI001E3EF132|nr:hypothetical protein [Stenotrophomonas sp. MMGLT7]MCD7099112.1 hypothetical protein [Stenotrophomonas sp. MMGLT7]
MTTSQTTTAAPTWIEGIRVGRHPSASGQLVDVTPEILREIAETYNPELHEAPVVVGHPKHNAPAYAWVGGVRIDGDVLSYYERDVEPQFAELRAEKRFKKRSLSLYAPNNPGNPTPGKWNLRHVGWLGAMPPAVKGLKDAPLDFSDSDGVVEFSFSDRRWGFGRVAEVLRRLRERMIETDGLETADSVLPSWEIESIREASQPDTEIPVPAFSDSTDPDLNPTEEPTVTDRTAEFAERERQLVEREERIAAHEQARAQAAAQQRRDDAVDFADGLVQAGKLLPPQKAAVVELMLALPTDAPLEFGEGADRVEQPAADLLRDLLEAFPPQIDFAEKARREDSLDFSDPTALADAARAYVEEQHKAGTDISVSAAVAHLTKGAK